MVKNVGKPDQFIRIAFALIIAVLYFTRNISGLAAIILGILAVVFLVTGFIRFCPLYLPFKLSTNKKSK
jgi:hypothetical protein